MRLSVEKSLQGGSFFDKPWVIVHFVCMHAFLLYAGRGVQRKALGSVTQEQNAAGVFMHEHSRVSRVWRSGFEV